MTFSKFLTMSLISIVLKYQFQNLRLCILFFFSKPGKMKEFVLDLFSGKLHREYHYGPDPVTSDVSIKKKLLKLAKKHLYNFF